MLSSKHWPERTSSISASEGLNRGAVQASRAEISALGNVLGAVERNQPANSEVLPGYEDARHG